FSWPLWGKGFGGGSRSGITQYPRARPCIRRFGPSSLVLEPAPDAVAGLVGLGARAHAARPQAHGRSGVHGAGPPTDARRRIEPPTGRRGRQVGGNRTTPPPGLGDRRGTG